MTTKVYVYGLRAPSLNADIVSDQMRKASAYRNKLTEIERERRSELRKVDDSRCSDLREQYEAARDRAADLLAEIKRNRQRTRSRSEDGELKERHKQAKHAARELMRAWREAVVASRQDEASQVARDDANTSAAAMRRAARADCGVYWGTYQLAEDADQAARKAPLWDRGEPNDPRFRRWDGEGAVSVQIIKGIDVPMMLSGVSSQVQIAESCAPSGIDPESKRSKRRQYATLRLRVGSDDRKPVWAEWPIVLHRPLPRSATIKRVTVQVRRIGPREEWRALFVLDGVPTVPSMAEGPVAIDVGWREIGDDLRIGVSFDGHATEDLRIPPRVMSGIAKADELRSLRDRLFDEQKEALADWLKACISSGIDVPQRIRDDIPWMHQWRAQRRMVSLLGAWKKERFIGDREMFDIVAQWARDDRHLWMWEANQRMGALRCRDDLYRNIAARIADRYSVLVLEKFDLREMKRNTDRNRENKAAKSNLHRAAIGSFRMALRNAFIARGGRVVEVDPENTTRECSVCGVVEEFDAGRKLRNTCPNGHEWDQDENAARNLFERWRRVADAVDARSDDGPKESRWSKARRMSAERTERMGRSNSDVDGSVALCDAD